MRYLSGLNSNGLAIARSVTHRVLAASVFVSPRIAHGDVTIVSQQTNVGSLSNPKLLSTTRSGVSKLYFHGNKIRMDLGQHVYLYDIKSHRRYRLNAARNTYSITPPTMQGMLGLENKIVIMTSVNLKPLETTRRTAGLLTKDYHYAATMSMSAGVKAPNAPGTSAAAHNDATVPFMVCTDEGTQWNADVPGLSAGQCAALPEVRGLNQIVANMPGMAAQALKGVFMGQHQVFTLHKSPLIGGGADVKMAVETMTTSISRGDLPDSLFEIPPGYKLADPGRKEIAPASTQRAAPSAASL